MLVNLRRVTTEVVPQNLQLTGAGFYITNQILKLCQEVLKRQLINRITRKYSTFHMV